MWRTVSTQLDYEPKSQFIYGRGNLALPAVTGCAVQTPIVPSGPAALVRTKKRQTTLRLSFEPCCCLVQCVIKFC